MSGPPPEVLEAIAAHYRSTSAVVEEVVAGFTRGDLVVPFGDRAFARCKQLNSSQPWLGIDGVGATDSVEPLYRARGPSAGDPTPRRSEEPAKPFSAFEE